MNLNIQFMPKYILTFTKNGQKTKQTLKFTTVNGKIPTPMEILIEAKKNGWTPTNLRPDPDCPAIIILRSEP